MSAYELRNHRERLGWSLSRCAAEIRAALGAYGLDRVDRQTVWRWETGAQEPSGATGKVVLDWMAERSPDSETAC